MLLIDSLMIVMSSQSFYKKSKMSTHLPMLFLVAFVIVILLLILMGLPFTSIFLLGFISALVLGGFFLFLRFSDRLIVFSDGLILESKFGSTFLDRVFLKGKENGYFFAHPVGDEVDQAVFTVANIASIDYSQKVNIKFKKPLRAILKSPWMWGDYKKSFDSGKRNVKSLSFSLEKPEAFILRVKELQKQSK